MSRDKDDQFLIDLVCKHGGFKLERCGEDWGGTYAWTTEGSSLRICGFKTEQKAKESFFRDRMSWEAGDAVLRVFRKLRSENRRLRKRLERATQTAPLGA